MGRRKIPYGISNYKEIVRENFLYVDKTRFIQELEQLSTKYAVFLRPRRFGKTLLVSTLQNYYDRNNRDIFSELFGHTYIGSHKTKLANSYYVMRFNFSGLSTENMEQLIASFKKSVEDTIIDFETDYKFNIGYDKNELQPARLLGTYLTQVRPYTRKNVYIMVDEYDHFANALLYNKEVFEAVTGKDGFVRQFYEVLKVHTEKDCINRIFITGVTSLTLDSFTSGFNISKNVSMFPDLNQMVGFTEEETRALLKEVGVADDEETMRLLKDNYNGYLFHQKLSAATERVYNSNMILYFLDEYQIYGKIPAKMIDPNIRSDYNKLTSMFTLFNDEGERQRVIEDIMSDKGMDTEIVTNFDFSLPFEQKDFLSLLFYLGLLTIKEEGHIFDVILQPPNAVIRDVYYQYYANYLKINEVEKRTAVYNIAAKNDFTELNALITNILKTHSNEDYRQFDEARLKSVFLSCFSNQGLFLVKSEYPSQGRKIDIALFDQRLRDKRVKYNYLIELKYIKKSQANEASVAVIKEKAISQMKEYLNLDEFKADARIKGVIYIVAKDQILYFDEVNK